MTRRMRAKGILVHYNPFHQIKHSYNQSIFAMVSKSFVSGRNAWMYKKKYSNDSAGLFWSIVSGFLGKSGAMLSAFWRARQAKSIGEFFLYLPFMCLFETANKLGFLWGSILSKKGTDSADPR